jgi:hypothetical protein
VTNGHALLLLYRQCFDHWSYLESCVLFQTCLSQVSLGKPCGGYFVLGVHWYRFPRKLHYYSAKEPGCIEWVPRLFLIIYIDSGNWKTNATECFDGQRNFGWSLSCTSSNPGQHRVSLFSWQPEWLWLECVLKLLLLWFRCVQFLIQLYYIQQLVKIFGKSVLTIVSLIICGMNFLASWGGTISVCRSLQH